MLRKQYHFRKIGGDLYAWDVHRLIRLSASLASVPVWVADIPELDENWWYETASEVPTPRALAGHMQLVQQADLAYPILLCAEGRLMDGMHRLVRAVMEKRDHVQAIRFPQTPRPTTSTCRPMTCPIPRNQCSSASGLACQTTMASG